MENDYSFLQIDEALEIDAFLIKHEHIQPVRMTSKGCIVISPEEKTFKLIARDTATKRKGLALDLQFLAPGLTRHALSTDSGLNRLTAESRCPSSDVQIAHAFLPLLKRLETQEVSFPMTQIIVYNHERKAALQRNIALGDIIPPIAIDIPDGSYTLEMQNYDAFDTKPAPAALSPPETCTLTVDSQRPTLRLNDETFTAVERAPYNLKITPGAKLTFQSDDSGAADIHICMKQRQDEDIQTDGCTEAEFKNIGREYNAPDRGAWDLYAFAVDRAGNRSAPLHTSFIVYQESLIAEIRAVSKLVTNYIQTNQEFNAFKSYQNLVSLAKGLVLKAEIQDIYWPLIAHYVWAAAEKHLIWERRMPEAFLLTESVAASPYNDDWAVGSNSDDHKSYASIGGQLITLDKTYHEFDFIDAERMVGIRITDQYNREETTLDFFDKGRLVHSMQFEGYLEDTVIDHHRESVVVVGWQQIVIVNYNSYDAKPIRLTFTSDVYINMELLITPDSRFYFVSHNDVIARIDPDMPEISVFSEPDECWIDKFRVIAANEIVYSVGPGWSGKDDCQKMHKINWKDGVPSRVNIIPESENDDVKTFALAKVEGKTILLHTNGHSLHATDPQSGSSTRMSLYMSIEISQLIEHPTQGDVLYIGSPNSITQIVIRADNILEETVGTTTYPPSEPEYATINLEQAERNLWVMVPTIDPSRILLFSANRIQLQNFQPDKNLSDRPFQCGNDCRISENGNYALAKDTQSSIIWSDVIHRQEKTVKAGSPMTSWILFDTGDVFFTTKAKQAFQWSHKTDEIRLVATFNGPGDIYARHFPGNGLITISTPFYANSIFGMPGREKDVSPKTMILHKENDSWISSGVRDGLPLVDSASPFFLFGRVGQNAISVELLDQQGEIVNSMEHMTFERYAAIKKLPSIDLSSSDQVAALAYTEDHIAVSSQERLLYSTCLETLLAFDLDTGEARPVKSLPDGYRAGRFDGRAWIQLIGPGGRDNAKRMNVETGEIVETYHDLPETPLMINGATYVIRGLRDPWGETFDTSGYRLFATTDPFVVGYLSRNEFIKFEGTMSIARADPDWIDRQLQKSPMYHMPIEL